MKRIYTIITLLILCFANVHAQKILKPMWSTAHVGTPAHFDNSGDKLLTFGWLSIGVWDNKADTLLYTFRCDSYLADAKFSNDGTKIAVVTRNGTVFIINAANGSEIHELNVGFQEYKGIEFSKNDSLIMAYSRINTVNIWSVKSGKHISKISVNGNKIFEGSFSNSGDYVLLRYDEGVALFYSVTGEYIKTFFHSGNTITAQFDKNDDRILIISRGSGIKLCDVKTGKDIYYLTGLPDIYNAKISPNGEYLLYTSGTDTIIVRDTYTGKKVVSLIAKNTNGIQAVQFSNSGDYVVCTNYNGTALLWSVKTGELIHTFLLKERHQAEYIEFEPNSNRFLTASTMGIITVWDIVTKEKVKEHFGYGGARSYPIFSTSGKRVIVGSFDFTIKVWNTDSGELELVDFQFIPEEKDYFVPHCSNNTVITSDIDGYNRIRDMESLDIAYNTPHTHNDFIFLPNCKQIIYKDATPHRFEIYDLVQNSVAKSILVQEPVYPFLNLRVSPDGSFLTARKDSSIYIWSLHSDSLIHTIKVKLPYYQFIEFMEFANDSTFIVGTFGSFKMIWINVKKGEIIQNTNLGLRVLYAGFDRSKSKLFVSTFEKNIEIRDANTGNFLSTIAMDKSVNSVDFREDKKLMLLAVDGEISIHNTATMEKIAQSEGFGTIVYAKFNETADRIVTSDNDGTIRVWDVGDLMTSINNDEYANNAQDISVSPNPATDEITIKGISSASPIRYTFTDLIGNTIHSGFIPEQTEEITLSTKILPSGFYNITFQMNGNKHIEKLIVVH